MKNKAYKCMLDSKIHYQTTTLEGYKISFLNLKDLVLDLKAQGYIPALVF